MTKTCPNCNKPIEDYNQFCPYCDYDFPREGEKASSGEAPREPTTQDTGLKCPNCGWPISKIHEYCPSCDFQLHPQDQEKQSTALAGEKIQEESDGEPTSSGPTKKQLPGPDANHEKKEVLGVQTEDPPNPQIAVHDIVRPYTCPNCGNLLPPGFNFRLCNKCGAPLPDFQPVPVPNQVPTFDGNMTARLITPFAPAGQTNVSQKTWINQSVPPVNVLYNEGKHYFVESYNFIELRIINTYLKPIENLLAEISGSLTPAVLTGKVAFPLAPQTQYTLRISGFKPKDTGKDALHLSIKGTVAGMNDFYLNGTFPLQVFSKEPPGQKVNLNISNISSKYMNLDLQDALDKLNPVKMNASPPEIERWAAIDLHFDTKKQERLSRFFPAPCVESASCPLEDSVLSSILAISPENAPKGVFSSSDGMSSFIVPGHTLFLGRDPHTNHVPILRFPEKDFESENAKISRNHCQIAVRDNRVFLRDTSTNGIFVGEKNISHNEDVQLASDEKVIFPNNLEVKVGIFTDGDKIIAVCLKRINNKANHQYILAQAPTPVGSRSVLPIQLAEGPDLYGFVYYHPYSHAWFFREPNQSMDLKLDKAHEFVVGSSRCWFSCL